MRTRDRPSLLPSPHYAGENFVGYDTVTFNKSTILTYNYAYGGATIDANLVIPYLPTVLSLTDQVNQFLAGAAKKPTSTPWTSANSLFTIWIGRFRIPGMIRARR